MFKNLVQVNRRVWILGVFALGVVLGNPSRAAAQASCRPIFDGIDKVMRVSTHVYSTVPREGAAPTVSEAIYVGGAIYLKNGEAKWQKIVATTATAAKQERDEREKADHTCRQVKEETVNGQAVTVHEMETKTATDVSKAQVWILKSNGQLLKQEIDIEDKKQGGKVHYSVRYEYDNVVAPKL